MSTQQEVDGMAFGVAPPWLRTAARFLATACAVGVVTAAGSGAYVPLGGDPDSVPEPPAAEQATDPASAAADPVVYDETVPARLANAIDGYGLTPVPANVLPLHQRLVEAANQANGGATFADDLELASADAKAWAARNDAVIHTTKPTDTDIFNTNVVVHSLQRALHDAALCLGQNMSGSCDTSAEGLLGIEHRLDMFGHDDTSQPDVADPLEPASVEETVAAYDRLYTLLETLLDEPISPVVVDGMAELTDDPLGYDAFAPQSRMLDEALLAILDGLHRINQGEPHIVLTIEAVYAQQDLIGTTDDCANFPTGRWCEALPFWRQYVIETIDRAEGAAP